MSPAWMLKPRIESGAGDFSMTVSARPAGCARLFVYEKATPERRSS
jgi:hypothetical protein